MEYEPGDLVSFAGKIAKVASTEEVIMYWGIGILRDLPNRIWAFYNGEQSAPTHTGTENIKMYRKFKKPVRRTLPDWF